jgi:NitT/TauT family transport system substrate-binding protein
MRARLLRIFVSVIAIALITSVTPSQAKEGRVAEKVRIGFFANVTHAPALVGQDLNLFTKALTKDGTEVEFIAFNAGPTAIEAMKAGAIDLTYIGPNPAINGFAGTRGNLLRIISGSTSGGAELVVRQNINSIEDLKGKKIASPQLGNTQDVALRAWLKEKGLSSSLTGGGDVTVIPTENAQTLTLFQRGDLDGAWLPEPWSTRLVLEANAKVFLNEASLWRQGKFVTTHIIAEREFLKKYPKTIRTILAAHIDAIKFIKRDPVAAKDAVQRQIERVTGKRLPDPVLNRAWGNLTFTEDPVAASLSKSADDAVEVGLLTNLGSRGLSGIYDLRIVNSLLREAKRKPVSNGGLGR